MYFCLLLLLFLNKGLFGAFCGWSLSAPHFWEQKDTRSSDPKYRGDFGRTLERLKVSLPPSCHSSLLLSFPWIAFSVKTLKRKGWKCFCQSDRSYSELAKLEVKMCHYTDVSLKTNSRIAVTLVQVERDLKVVLKAGEEWVWSQKALVWKLWRRCLLAVGGVYFLTLCFCHDISVSSLTQAFSAMWC